jgi:hypothetical protein
VETPERKFIQNYFKECDDIFIKKFDEIMLDKNINQDEKWNKLISARINLTKELK